MLSIYAPRAGISPAVPKRLWLTSTAKWQKLSGFYNLVPDRQANWMPVWKSGKNWMYSAGDGKWCVTDDEKDIAGNLAGISSAVHGGLMPDVTAWDAGVSVASDRDSGAVAAWDVPGYGRGGGCCHVRGRGRTYPTRQRADASAQCNS
eukprot:gene19077-biopygen43162